MIGQIFDTLFLAPVINLLVLILHGFEAINIPGALGFAIIVLTIIVRMIVWPLMSSQIKSAKKLTDLKPQMSQLKKKHQGDKAAFAAAQMALYKEHGVNPAGGCLPTLIQFPVLIALYQAVFAFFNGANGLERINKLLYVHSWDLREVPDLNFFGLNLTLKPSDFNQAGILLLLIPIITGLLQMVQSKMMTPTPLKERPGDSPKEKKEKEGMEESLSAVQSQMVFLMPLMVGYFAFQFPIALSLYWNTLTILGIIQQYLISGWGGMDQWIGKIKK